MGQRSMRADTLKQSWGPAWGWAGAAKGPAAWQLLAALGSARQHTHAGASQNWHPPQAKPQACSPTRPSAALIRAPGGAGCCGTSTPRCRSSLPFLQQRQQRQWKTGSSSSSSWQQEARPPCSGFPQSIDSNTAASGPLAPLTVHRQLNKVCRLCQEEAPAAVRCSRSCTCHVQCARETRLYSM